MNKVTTTKMSMIVLVCIGSLASALGQDVSGLWNGKGMLDAKRVAELTIDGHNYNAQIHDLWKKTQFVLTLNADGTFRLSRRAEDGTASPSSRTRVTEVRIGGYGGTVEGTYARKGAVLTLVITREDGAAPKAHYKAAIATLSDDGKSLKLVSADLQTALGVYIEFSREK